MKFLFVASIFLCTAGCSMFNAKMTSSQAEDTIANDSRTVAAPMASAHLFQSKKAVPNTASQMTSVSRKNINHYVRGMMQDMAENLQYVTQKTPLAVSSFVFLDDEYDDSSLLGNQLSESFMHELHHFGVSVIDFKTTDYMRVTPQGDFVFSRDYLELNEDQNFQYVLAGTLVNHQGGVLVNARIIGLMSKAVVGSAQGFIPQTVVDALGSSYRTDGIMMKKADR